MSPQLLEVWTDDEQTPLATNREEIYSYPKDRTPSVHDALLEKIKESFSYIDRLKERSETASKESEELVPLSKSVVRDAKKLLESILHVLPQPEIDWEETEGYLNISWRFDDHKILSTLIRGDSFLIFSGVFENGQVVEGTPALDKAPGILLAIFDSYR